MKDDDISGQVRGLIRHSIGHGCCTLGQVATSLAISPRTLQRRLAAQGVTFKDLVIELRMELACQLLEGTNIPMGRLAQRVGYTEASAFTRAFRQHTGKTPRLWRNEKRMFVNRAEMYPNIDMRGIQ
jgi:AraC-like DNA-binding protein